ncbi:MAG: DUF1456 family protein [Ghiorsea sp.]
MLNNDVLRRIRYSFDLSDTQVINTFAAANKVVSRTQISDWLKKEEDPAFVECSDLLLAYFLDGFINEKRGKREGRQSKPESHLTNNLIFIKLRIALALKDDDILNILSLVDFKLSKHELSAFFRAPEHRQSRQCKDQVLRNFLNGLQAKYRKPEANATKQIKVGNVAVDVKNEPNRVVFSKKRIEKKVKPEKEQERDVLTLGKPKFQWKKD